MLVTLQSAARTRRESESESGRGRPPYTQSQKYTDPAALTYGVIMNSLARSVNVLNVTIAHKSIYYVLPHAVHALIIVFRVLELSMVTKWSRTRWNWLTDINFWMLMLLQDYLRLAF